MQINMAVEPLVREAFGAALGQDIDRLIAVGQDMAKGGEQVTRDTINLAGAVTAFALFDLHGGAGPEDEQSRELASQFVEMNEWADFDAETAYIFLSGLSNQRDIREILPPETVARLVFVIGAWLLAAFGPEDRHWYTYLDQIENALESA
jgi:hypothetical protein